MIGTVGPQTVMHVASAAFHQSLQVLLASRMYFHRSSCVSTHSVTRTNGISSMQRREKVNNAAVLELRHMHFASFGQVSDALR